jgi:glycerate kinase
MTGARRYLVAPDKFKGTLTAPAAASAIARGIRRADPTAHVVELPFADGGEGTIDAVVAAGGQRCETEVVGPLGGRVLASWARLGLPGERVAVIEMAQASGLRLVTPTPGTALHTYTGGTGELITAALDDGVTRIVLGVGGSATTDGGFGALRALGARFCDASGAEIRDVGGLARVHALDLDALHPRLADVEIEVCADVLTPLVGPHGAARVFARQKGADAAAIAVLEARLEALARLYRALPGGGAAVMSGGAAGGLAAGVVAALGARIRSGVDVMAAMLGLEARIRAADVVVVGEGSLDRQSLLGKAPLGIARRARDLGVPVLAVVGTCALAPAALRDDGIVHVSTAVDQAPDPATALAAPAEYIARAAESAVRALLAAGPIR